MPKYVMLELVICAWKAKLIPQAQETFKRVYTVDSEVCLEPKRCKYNNIICICMHIYNIYVFLFRNQIFHIKYLNMNNLRRYLLIYPDI